MKIAERQRRHDELFQTEVADGLGRILSVLHDISDGIREFQRTTTSAPEVVLTDTPAVHQQLLSVKDLAEMLGTSTGFVYGLRASGNGPVATKVGGRLLFQRADIEDWLHRQRETPGDNTQPWRGSFMPGRIGANLPRTSEPQKRAWCSGSHTEPMTAAKYTGRGVCRVCKDDVLVNRDGRLHKHLPRWW